jgi:hypothetical protein
MSPEPTFFQIIKAKIISACKWLTRVLLSPGAALVVLVGALLFVFGFRNLQIGGLLGKLFMKKDPDDAIDVANSVPDDRVDENGNIIKPGEADKEGMTQATVVPIDKPGLFSNPDTVKFKPPGETKPVEIKLPTGVKAKDVEKVVVVKPKKFAVTVKDASKVKAKDIDALLDKYS